MQCSIGAALNKRCSTEKVFKDRSYFSTRDLHLIFVRSGVEAVTVCSLHDRTYRVFYAQRQLYCCNPLKLHRNTRTCIYETVSPNLHDACRQILPSVIEGKKLCVQCRIGVRKFMKEATKATETAAAETAIQAQGEPMSEVAAAEPRAGPSQHAAQGSSSQGSSSLSECDEEVAESSGSVYSSKKEVFNRLNKGLQALGESPLRQKKLYRSKKYPLEKLKKTKSMFKKSLEKVIEKKWTEDGPSTADEAKAKEFEQAGKEMLEQMKEKFETTKKSSEKIHILSVLPKSWNVPKIQKEFQTSTYLAKKVKKCVSEYGIFCTPNPKPGKTLSDQTVEKIRAFYREPDISRELPGRKECKSVVVNGGRVLKQKRLILGNLKEIYALFKEKFPYEKVGFSKFSELRPAECVLAGASGTHTVCVCLLHQNFKLQFLGGKLNCIKKDGGEVVFKSYRDVLQISICTHPTEECFIGSCKSPSCGKTDEVREIINTYFTSNLMDDVTFKRWTQVDRCSLETVVMDVDSFCDSFVESISKVLHHDYTARKQADFFRDVKDKLKIGEVLVVADFSENYSFVLQDSVQGVHWNNTQCTVHPFACYYIDKRDVRPLNFIVLSDSLSHVTATVHTFQGELIKFLKNKIPNLSKVIYFSDGAPSQYKNRFNVLNVLMHEDDFGIPAEWHYFATSHGKGPSDGLGGTVKRLAARASLQRTSDDQIQTPLQLFEWVSTNIKGMSFAFVSASEVEARKKCLKRRFHEAPHIHEIRQCHAAVPESRNTICMKKLSSSALGVSINIKETGSADAEPSSVGVMTRYVSEISLRRE